MSSRLVRRLSYAAVLSTSLSGLAVAGQAHATNSGDAANSPLTIADRNVTFTPDGTDALGAWSGSSWSPDGSMVVYEGYGDARIMISGADGSGPTQVGSGSGNPLTDHPVYAFDGEQLVYSALVPGTSQHSIYTTYANGAGVDQYYIPHQSQLSRVATPAGSDDIRPDYGGGAIAFERVTGGVSSIYVRAYGSTQNAYKVAAGSRPTVSPDGATVAFVAPDADGQDQIWTAPTSAPAGGVLAAPIRQTGLTGGLKVTQAVFSPDGASLAFVVSDPSVSGWDATVRTVDRTADPAAPPNQDSQVSIAPYGASLTGGTTTLSYRTEFAKHIVHVAGDDRLGTAVAASQTSWRDDGDTSDKERDQAAVAVLSRSDTFADALGGAALAAHKGGPLLLTESGTLDQSVLTEMQRILPQGSTVYLLGGTGALSPAVEAAVRQAGFTPSRIAGATRYETSVAVAKASVTGTPDNILIATGDNFPDALSAGAAAAADPGAVVVLSDDKKMPAATASYLKSFNTNFQKGPTLWAVGGQALSAVDTFSADKWYRVPEKGGTRYDTSLMLAHDFFGNLETVGFATALNFPDSLAGGAVMGSWFGPLLLVDPTSGLTSDEKAFLAANRGEISQAFLFGGQVANSSLIGQQVADGIAGPMGIAPDGAAAGVRPMRSSVPGSTDSRHGVVAGPGARTEPTLP